MSGHQPSQQSENAETDVARRRKEKQAVEAVRSGDAEAFAELVSMHEARVMALCVALMRDAGAAEELAQDVFVRAYRYIETFDDRRDLYPWLAKIAYRLAQTRWKQNRRQATLAENLGARLDADSHNHNEIPLDGLVADEQSRHLRTAVRSLPERERTAVVLYYAQGMDVRQVAGVMGVSTGAVKSFLFRARRHLQSKLRQTDGRRPGGSTK